MKEYNKQKIYKNFNRKNKWFGIIDYKSLVILVAYIFLIITILRYINIKLEYACKIHLLNSKKNKVSIIYINLHIH